MTYSNKLFIALGFAAAIGLSACGDDQKEKEQAEKEKQTVLEIEKAGEDISVSIETIEGKIEIESKDMKTEVDSLLKDL